MELKELVRKYFQDDWTEEEKGWIEKAKILHIYMGMAEIGVDNMRDINLILTEPDSNEAIYLKELFRSKTCDKSKTWSRSLDYLEEIATLDYLYTKLPNAELFLGHGRLGSSTGFILRQASDDFNFELSFSPSDDGISKNFHLSTKKYDLKRLEQELSGTVRYKFKPLIYFDRIEMPLDKHNPEDAYRMFCEEVQRAIKDCSGNIEENAILDEIILDMGEDTYARIHWHGTLDVRTEQYTEQLGKLLDILNIY